MGKIWKPTQAECNLIRKAASRESCPGIAFGAVVLEPGYRCNVDDHTVESSMNIASVTKEGFDGDWGDTDLADYGEWKEFRKGIELTEAGEAIVDFYIRKRGDDFGELCGNVTVYYKDGNITRIHGYGNSSEYPIK